MSSEDPSKNGKGWDKHDESMADQEIHIPTINIGPLLENGDESYTEEDRAETASTLMKACQTHGLFFVTGHGITATQRRTAFDNARRFFSLSEATKRKIPAKKGGFTRGYIGFGGESGSHLLECKEAFSYGYPWPDGRHGNALQGPNIWPESDVLGKDWQDSMIELFRLMVSVNEAVARGLSLSPDLGLQDLPTLCQGGDTISLLRLFHYFPYHNNDSSSSSTENRGGDDEDRRTKSDRRKEGGEGKIGSSPHTDWGLSTSILQDGAGGLQFLEQESQRWIDVPCTQEDALVFNCGDYLSLLSNGRLKSPVHQVVTTGVERTSFVFFYYPNFDAKLPGAATPGGAAEGSGITGAGAASTSNRGGVAAGGANLQPSPGVAGTEDLAAARTDIKAGAAASGVAAAVTAVPAAESAAVAKIGAYNTLLDLKRGDAESSGDAPAVAGDESFGQYLARKWGAVFRE